MGGGTLLSLLQCVQNLQEAGIDLGGCIHFIGRQHVFHRHPRMESHSCLLSSLHRRIDNQGDKETLLPRHCLVKTQSQPADLVGGERVKQEHRMQKLLFVCSRNRRRSLTAEKLFEGSPLYQVRSVGTQPDARIVVTEGHIGWADLIFCMEKSHVRLLQRKFPEATSEKKVICLNIPDEFEFMDAAFIDELRGSLAPYVALPEG
jgi:predicted protein tyrosine phosphatase